MKSECIDKGGILQYNESKWKISDMNILESITTNKDVYFNESYLLIGDALEAKNIYACYNLTVIGDIFADELTVNGELYVTGKINVNKLRCLKHITCDSWIKADIIDVDNDIIAKSIVCNKINSSGDVIVSTTFDVSDECNIKKSLIACEGITGVGNYNVKNTIAIDYFEFNGNTKGNIFEASTNFMNSGKSNDIENKSLDEQNKLYTTIFYNMISDICKNEEEQILIDIDKFSSLNEMTFYELKRLLEEIIRISYQNKIENYRDYLIVIYASYKFPESLKRYETIEHVFNEFISEAKNSDLDYSAKNFEEFVLSLRIIDECCGLEEIDKNYAADKVFSFIGIRFNTVKKQFKGDI